MLLEKIRIEQLPSGFWAVWVNDLLISAASRSKEAALEVAGRKPKAASAKKASAVKTIEKMMSTNHSVKTSSIHKVEGKAVFTNGHWLYEVNPELIKEVNPDYIATAEETMKNDLFSAAKYKRVIPCGEPDDTITVTYKYLMELKKTTQENSVPKYGAKGTQKVGRLEGKKGVIFVVLDNLIDACKVLGQDAITLNIYKSAWTVPTTNGKFISLAPLSVCVNGNLFVCTPVNRRR